ncbi:MAG: sce7726 family protein [Lachnospiraceae bacterium]|nr:sce7726 family protein [Lachnospiraceae bacterium]
MREEKVLHDKDIREPLFDFLEDQYGKVRIIEEKQMGRSRADLVMVTEDALTGIEIKSDADSYARLGRQVKDYDRYFDRNVVVVGSSHAMHIEEHVPAWWGIITAEQEAEGVDFYFLRRPQENPKMEWGKKLEILWRNELAGLQKLVDMPAYAQKSKAFVIGKLIELVPPDQLCRAVSEELFERDYQEMQERMQAYQEKREASGAKRRAGGKRRRKRKPRISRR